MRNGDGQLMFGGLIEGVTLEGACLALERALQQPAVCLLNKNWPLGQHPMRICPVHMNVQDLMNELGNYLRYAGPAVTLVSDGEWGHAITVYHVRDATVGFADPSPGRSLLCKEKNIVGASAVPGPSGWELARTDFARVLVASIVPARDWELARELGSLPREGR